MSKSIKNIFERICTTVGKNNKSIYPVIAIATVKGICRPTFTMMDKTENPETKKYTAIREGLTEVIAIPTYFCCGKASEALSKLFPQALRSNAATNLMFIGVCAAALVVIPALCSAAIKPLMEKIQKKNADKNVVKPIVLDTAMQKTRFPMKYSNTYSHLNSFSSRTPGVYTYNRIGGL